MKRERLEDLGRIRVLLENISDMEIFSIRNSCIGKKDYLEWFREQKEEKQDDIIEQMIYGLDAVDEKISECINIARGHDED